MQEFLTLYYIKPIRYSSKLTCCNLPITPCRTLSYSLETHSLNFTTYSLFFVTCSLFVTTYWLVLATNSLTFETYSLLVTQYSLYTGSSLTQILLYSAGAKRILTCPTCVQKCVIGALQAKDFIGLEHTEKPRSSLNPIRPGGKGGGGSEARMTKLTAANQKPLNL